MSLLFKNCSKTKLSQPITQPCHNMFKWDEVQSLFPAVHRLDSFPANTLDLSDTCACSPLCQPVTGDVFRHAKNATVILLQIKLTGQIKIFVFKLAHACVAYLLLLWVMHSAGVFQKTQSRANHLPG